MNKLDLAETLAQEVAGTKKEALKYLDALFGQGGIVPEALINGEEVKLPGFGLFTVKELKARTARNPRTGEQVNVGPRKAIRFRPLSRLKNAVKEAQ
jgi:nucleoid DNA-binding protein